MAKKKEEIKLSGGNFFMMPDREEDKSAKTYRERIAPKLMPVEEYFATVEPWEEWYKRHEEKALSNYYGVPITVTVLGRRKRGA